MRTTGTGTGRYSPLKEAHGRVAAEKSGANAREMTDMRVERAARDLARLTPATVERTAPHPPRAAGIQGAAAVVVGGPAPGETQAHFVWRELLTARLAQERAAREAKQADEVPRIERTEKSPIHRKSELGAVMARLEQAEADKQELGPQKEQVPEIEPERQ